MTITADPWLAPDLSAGPRVVRQRLLRAHEGFDGRDPAAGVRPVIARSWRRSLRAGVSRSGPEPSWLARDELETLRATHPLRGIVPVVRDLLVRDADRNDMIVALGDASGRLLWVEGHAGLRTRAERMGFVPGAAWSEDEAGTAAPGMAVRLDHPVQIFGAEHWAEAAAEWSCSAAPVHDPVTGAVLGFLDVTGGDDLARPAALTLVRAAASAAESHLLLLARRGPHPAPPARRLEVLGHPRLDGTALPVRHAEILVLLAGRPDGLTAEELGLLLHPRGLTPVTVRAEVARLRRRWHVDVSPRPYRLRTSVDSDLAELVAALREGRGTDATRLYGQGLLPGSDSPAVREIDAELSAAVARTRITAV